MVSGKRPKYKEKQILDLLFCILIFKIVASGYMECHCNKLKFQCLLIDLSILIGPYSKFY